MKHLVFIASLSILSMSICFAQNEIQVTRYDGVGTSNYLELTDNSINDILTNNFASVLTYKEDRGPFKIKNVTDPSLIGGDYRLTLVDENFNTTGQAPKNWILEDINTGMQWVSDQPIDISNTQEITGRGFSLEIVQPKEPGEDNGTSPLNGFIGSSIFYKDNNSTAGWLQGIKDEQFSVYTDFIRTGPGEENYQLDPGGNFSNVISGTWFPYTLTSWKPNPSVPFPYITPSWVNNFGSQVDFRNTLDLINNVNIVLTPDKSKWSRCIVINTFSPDYASEGAPNPDSAPFALRGDPSVDKNGNSDNTGTGKSWFPGYAIDVETGKRLNIFFGENTFFNPGSTGVPGSSQSLGLPTINGKDMIWNPNNELVTPIGSVLNSLVELPLGGQHFIYVTDELYDECNQLHIDMGGSPFSQINAWAKVKWTTIPVLRNGTSLLSIQNGLIPNETTIKIRVNNKFDIETATNMNNGFPMYEFSLDSYTISNNESLTAKDKITLSPNPLSLQEFSVARLEHLPDNVTISIYNALGVLKSENTTITDGNFLLDPKALGIHSTGMHYVVITPAVGKPLVKKWMIL